MLRQAVFILAAIVMAVLALFLLGPSATLVVIAVSVVVLVLAAAADWI